MKRNTLGRFGDNANYSTTHCVVAFVHIPLIPIVYLRCKTGLSTAALLCLWPLLAEMICD